MASLQDQLLKAGMIDKNKAQKIKKDKHKKVKKAAKNQGDNPDNEAKQLAEKARAEKIARDQEINRQQKQEADRKAIEAQLKQLIEMNKIDRSAGEIAYQFTHGKSIKKLYVTNEQQTLLTRGRVAIVSHNEQYELVPVGAAEKIAQRDDSRVVLLNASHSQHQDDDDPYADYQIPDDLMW